MNECVYFRHDVHRATIKDRQRENVIIGDKCERIAAWCLVNVAFGAVYLITY